MTIKEENQQLVKNIQEICAERGMTVKALEKAVTFPNGTIGKWTHAVKRPPSDRVKAVADFFGVPVARITGKGLYSSLYDPELNALTNAAMDVMTKEKPAPMEGDGLSAEFKEWVDAWDNATPEARKAALAVLKLQGRSREDQG